LRQAWPNGKAQRESPMGGANEHPAFEGACASLAYDQTLTRLVTVLILGLLMNTENRILVANKN